MDKSEQMDFKEGQTVWCPDGRKAEFVASTSHGCVVRLGYYRPSDDGEYGDEYFDGVEIVNQVFASAPTAAIEKRIAELATQLRAAHDRLNSVESDIAAAERQHTDRLKRLAKFPPLEMLEALLEGKVTHFVTKHQYSEVADIQTFEEATTRVDREYGRENKDIRMLALVGRGDLLTWRINEYYDGSGSWNYDAYPCLSYDDALRKVSEIGRAAAGKLAPGKVDSRHASVADNAKKYGYEIPAWIPEAVSAAKAEAVRAKIAKAEAELAAAKAKAEATP